MLGDRRLNNNFGCLVICILLDRGNWIGCHDIRVRHSSGIFHVALHYNASALFSSWTTFSAVMWPTVAGCFATHWPHDSQEPARS